MIKLENIFVSYDNNTVLKNINLEFKKGENVSIIGTNGCGKTTLLKTICNTISFEGDIFFNKKNIKKYTQKELAKKIGMLSQVNQICFNYTVFDIVMMGRYVYNTGFFSTSSNRLNDEKIVNEVLKTLDIYNLKDREIDTLSGGQVQKVFLAKLIAQDPSVVILDEPTNHLDLSFQIELIKFLKKWSKQKDKLIIGVLHDINLAMFLSDNILLLNNGEVLQFGKIKDVLTSKNINKIYKMDIKNYMLQTLKKWESI